MNVSHITAGINAQSPRICELSFRVAQPESESGTDLKTGINECDRSCTFDVVWFEMSGNACIGGFAHKLPHLSSGHIISIRARNLRPVIAVSHLMTHLMVINHNNAKEQTLNISACPVALSVRQLTFQKKCGKRSLIVGTSSFSKSTSGSNTLVLIRI